MSNEEVDFDTAKPSKVQEIINHFNAGAGEKVNPLAYTELCEGILREGFLLTEKRKELVDAEKDLKDEVKVFLGKERGLIARGMYAVEAKESKGRETVKWEDLFGAIESWAVGEIGPEAKALLAKLRAQFTKVGDPILSVEFKKIG